MTLGVPTKSSSCSPPSSPTTTCAAARIMKLRKSSTSACSNSSLYYQHQQVQPVQQQQHHQQQPVQHQQHQQQKQTSPHRRLSPRERLYYQQQKKYNCNINHYNTNNNLNTCRNFQNSREFQYVAEYHHDILEYLTEMEYLTVSRIEPSLIDHQPELRWTMRPMLIDFLIDVQQHSRLRPDTLHLALNIIDRYSSRRMVFKTHYQLLGCAALWIAAKFEDPKERVPTLAELTQWCTHSYDSYAFVKMEAHVLQTLDWLLGHPAPETFLRLSLVNTDTTATLHISRFLLDLCLYSRDLVNVIPSVRARASLALARTITGTPVSPYRLSSQVRQVAIALDQDLAENPECVSARVNEKYSRAPYSRASIIVREFYSSGKRFLSPIKRATPRDLSPVITDYRPSLPSTVSRSNDYRSRSLHSATSSTSSASSLSSLESSSTTFSDDTPATPATSVSTVDEPTPATTATTTTTAIAGSSAKADKENDSLDFNHLSINPKLAAATAARNAYLNTTGSQRFAPYRTNSISSRRVSSSNHGTNSSSTTTTTTTTTTAATTMAAASLVTAASTGPVKKAVLNTSMAPSQLDVNVISSTNNTNPNTTTVGSASIPTTNTTTTSTTTV